MKSVLISIQPYWVFLIIARLMGWNIPQEKTVEVRKDYPKDKAWNKRVHIYCSKSRKSFNRIPKEYQPLMEKLLGKVIGSFVCDKVERFTVGSLRCDDIERMACLSYSEMLDYFYKPNELDGKTVKFGYAWHISDLKIYDKPKELGEFKNVKVIRGYHRKDEPKTTGINIERLVHSGRVRVRYLNRPPQSRCYIEKL